MYIVIALIAAFAYALQGTLMASFYRKMDTLSVVAYRGLAIGLATLPLLFFLKASDFATVPSIMGSILLCSVVAACGNWFIANAVCRLPVGIASALLDSFRTVTAIALAIFFLGEMLNGIQFAFIGALLACVVTLCLSKKSAGSEPLPPAILFTGIAFALASGVSLGCAMGMIGATSRSTHPLLIVFLWELTIGLVAMGGAFARGKLKGGVMKGFSPISLKDFGRVVLCSSPTIIGTAGYAFAAKLGSIAVVSAVLSAGSVIAALIAFVLYRERLTSTQYAMIALCCTAIAGLNLV